jgi:hypothetical protein
MLGMTDTTEKFGVGDGILKVDRLGRVQTPPERREALLDEFEKGAMSAKAFAERYGIKYQTFCYWRHRRQKASEKSPRPKRSKARSKRPGKSAECLTLALAEVAEVPDPGAAARAALEIELAGGHRLAVNDAKGAALAAELIGALGRAETKA